MGGDPFIWVTRHRFVNLSQAVYSGFAKIVKVFRIAIFSGEVFTNLTPSGNPRNPFSGEHPSNYLDDRLNDIEWRKMGE
jgi:hypothetical protein